VKNSKRLVHELRNRRHGGRDILQVNSMSGLAAVLILATAFVNAPTALADNVTDEVGRAGAGVCPVVAEDPHITAFRTLAGIAAKSPKLTDDGDVVQFLVRSVDTYCPQYNYVANAYLTAVVKYGLPPAWCVPSTRTPVPEMGGRVMVCP
jgi:hypothetical protein